MSKAPKNYRWWQDHGRDWSDEVARRKARMPIYHLQEIFLEEYMGRCAPAKVLDFGCGFGRHLEYLRHVPDLDVYGFDQSESMLSGMRWAKPAWRQKRITLGKPLAKLPYEDDSFDVVFTVSVLIHVRPPDLDKLLGELLRVCRGHLLHIENNVTSETVSTSDAHDGCWAHDLAAAYARLCPDRELEVFPQLFEIEDVYRLVKAEERAPRMMTAPRAARFLALDRSLTSEIQQLQQQASRSTRQRDALEARMAELKTRLEEGRERLKAAGERGDGLESALAEALHEQRAQRERARGAESKLAQARSELRLSGERLREGLGRIESLEADQTRLLGRARTAEERIEGLQARVRQSEQAAAALRERAREAEARFVQMQARALAGEEKSSRLLASMREAQQRIEELGHRLEGSIAERDDLLVRAAESGREMRALREREESAVGLLEDARLRMQAETQRADQLDAALMLAHTTQDRLVGQERDAQSRVIALRNRSERAEAELIRQRARAVAAEDKVVVNSDRAIQAEEQIYQLLEEIEGRHLDQLAQRERADEALGKIDAARREQNRVEAELDALRLQLAEILGG